MTLLITGGLAVYQWDWLQTAGNGLDESNSTTTRNVGLLIAAFLAGILAIWRSAVADRQARAANRQADVAQAQATTAQESLRHDRYQRGAEMLGSELLPVRLAGISALNRLAADYPDEYHIQIFELFCGFARSPTGDEELSWTLADLENVQSSLSRYREDVQAVMTAIGTRGELGKTLEAEAGFSLDLQGANLTHISLENADLKGADLRRAKLAAVYARDVNLSGASLLAAILYKLTGEGLNLSGANLAGTIMVGMTAENTNFFKATLYGANLKEACLNGSNFSGAILGQSDLTTVQLEQADFSGVHISPGLGLTQGQLNNMKASPENPPDIAEGAKDSDTGKPLVWQG